MVKGENNNLNLMKKGIGFRIPSFGLALQEFLDNLN